MYDYSLSTGHAMQLLGRHLNCAFRPSVQCFLQDQQVSEIVNRIIYAGALLFTTLLYCDLQI